jgi:hypothetical protein
MEQEEQEEEERQAREAEAAAAAAASEREQTGGRLQSRPSLEILQPTPLKIHLQNGHYKTFSYSTKTLARDIIAQLAHKLDIRSPELYTLCLRAPGKPVVSPAHLHADTDTERERERERKEKRYTLRESGREKKKDTCFL